MNLRTTLLAIALGLAAAVTSGSAAIIFLMILNRVIEQLDNNGY